MKVHTGTPKSRGVICFIHKGYTIRRARVKYFVPYIRPRAAIYRIKYMFGMSFKKMFIGIMVYRKDVETRECHTQGQKKGSEE